MNNIKISIAPPYKAGQETYTSKVEASFEFADENEALNFYCELTNFVRNAKSGPYYPNLENEMNTFFGRK